MDRYQPSLKDKNWCRDCQLMMTSCMISYGPTTWHYHDITYDIIMTSPMTSSMTSPMTSCMTSCMTSPMTSCGPTTWHHHDIMWSHHMTSSMTSSWHLSLSIHIHLTSVTTSVQRWSRQHIQCISLQYIFYTCIIQPTKSLHQLYGLELAIGPTLGPKPNPLNHWT